MKKLLFLCCIATVIWSCKKDGSSSISKVDTIESKSDKAAYAYGLNMSNNVESYKKSPFFKNDSLINDEIIKGFNDFLSNSSDKTLSYAVGQQLAIGLDKQIKDGKFGDNFNTDLIVQGLMDKLNNDSILIPSDSAQAFIMNFQTEIINKKKIENLEKSNKYLAEQEKTEGVKKTESGLLYQVLTEGSGGPKPQDTDVIKAKYEGKLMDGTVFDSTEKNNGIPIELQVNQFVPGFTEGLKLMSVGDKYKFIIPPVLAYGERGAAGAGIGPNDALVFEVELLEINPKKEEAPQPQLNIQPSGK